jgi:hypothetical protein
MGAGLHDLPDDIEALKAALIVERDRRIVAEADAAAAKAKASDDRALIAHLKLEIEKLKREIYGPRSERTARLSISWSYSSRSSRARPPRMSSPPRRPQPR